MITPHDGMEYPLCRQCKESFEWGQARAEAEFRQLSNDNVSEPPEYQDGQERLVELYVGIQGGDSSGSWHVADVYVPAAIPEDQAGEAAIQKYRSELDANDDSVAFIGVYSVWDDDEMAEFWNDDDLWEDDFWDDWPEEW